MRALTPRHSPSPMPSSVLNTIWLDISTVHPANANSPIVASAVLKKTNCRHQISPASPAKRKLPASGAPAFV